MAPDRLADDADRCAPTVSGRLDSWKEIAAYLRRDVRTVQRWHHRAGLPVHRHVDARQRGVFAFPGELDGWANRFRQETEPGRHAANPDDEPPRHKWLRASRWVMGGALLLVVSALVGSAFRPTRGVLPLHDRAWVLVAEFENHTGEEVLDGSVQFAVERELAASAFVSVLPRLRVQDTLRLMRRPADSAISPPLARELALRDGGVRAIVAGRVEATGAGYLLTIEIVDPQTGATLRSRIERVPVRSGLLVGVRRLAAWARRTLGETVAASSHEPRLPQVTTTSLTALQLYGKAEDALARNHRQAARVLLEAAVREDPEFALAHSTLAMALLSDPEMRAPGEVAQHHARQALALSRDATEKERLRIVARHYLYHGEPAEDNKALAAWEALASIDPHDWDARQHLAGLYYRMRRVPEAVRAAERAAQLRPNDFMTMVRAAQAWALWAGQSDAARQYVQQARALWSAEAEMFASEVGLVNLPPGHARAAAWILLFSPYERWHAGEIEAMLVELQQVLDADPLPTPADRDALLTIAIGLQMSAGRLKDARELARQMFQERLRELHLAVIADAVDDVTALRHHMARVPVDGEQRALRLVRAGLHRQAEYVLARDRSNQGYRETARGELALRRGRIAAALEDLQRGVALASAHTLSEHYLGAESLASALERLNRHDEALEVLKAAAGAEPRYTRTGPSGAFWLRVLARLSRTYRELGQHAEADAIDARLRRLLVLADSDHPLLTQLASRGQQRDQVP